MDIVSGCDGCDSPWLERMGMVPIRPRRIIIKVEYAGRN
jgi:hypothetical protein